MRWRRQHWPEREPRPEARTLTDEEKKKLLATMTREIAASPVLTGLGLQVRSQRGRFYLERPLGEGDAAGVEAWGRITPLADSTDLLLEQERRKGSWSEIDQGIGPETHQDHRRRHQGDVPRPRCARQGVATGRQGAGAAAGQAGGEDDVRLCRDGRGCSAQEALFHYFGLPLHVLVEPSEWYSYHRKPTIVEASEDRTRVLVRFGADEFVGGELRRDLPVCPAGTGAGGPTGSGPARAGTSPLPRRGW